MKALLILKNAAFPKTHDLLMLSTLCEEAGILIPFDAQGLNALNNYAILVRYPGENPTVEDAHDALRIAQSIRRFARKFMGL